MRSQKSNQKVYGDEHFEEGLMNTGSFITEMIHPPQTIPFVPGMTFSVRNEDSRLIDSNSKQLVLFE